MVGNQVEKRDIYISRIEFFVNSLKNVGYVTKWKKILKMNSETKNNSEKK